jgi:hypothetical protein
MDYDLQRWRDPAGAWHFRLVRRERAERADDEHFEARLGYLRFLITRGLVRFDGEQPSSAI